MNEMAKGSVTMVGQKGPKRKSVNFTPNKFCQTQKCIMRKLKKKEKYCKEFIEGGSGGVQTKRKTNNLLSFMYCVKGKKTFTV